MLHRALDKDECEALPGMYAFMRSQHKHLLARSRHCEGNFGTILLLILWRVLSNDM